MVDDRSEDNDSGRWIEDSALLADEADSFHPLPAASMHVPTPETIETTSAAAAPDIGAAVVHSTGVTATVTLQSGQDKGAKAAQQTILHLRETNEVGSRAFTVGDLQAALPGRTYTWRVNAGHCNPKVCCAASPKGQEP